MQVDQAEQNYLEHIIAQNSANDKIEDTTLTALRANGKLRNIS